MHDAILDVVEQTQRECGSLVYLMKADRDLKIGFSANVCKRLYQLLTGSPIPIRLLAVAPGGRTLEKKLHAEFAPWRRQGEWFRDRRQEIVTRFATLPGAMVFISGYITQSNPLLGVTE